MARHDRDVTTPTQSSMPSSTPAPVSLATSTFPPIFTTPRKRALTTLILPPPRSSRSPSLSFVLTPTYPNHSRKQNSTSFNPITSPRNSPPPDFLLDDDPFADLTGGAKVNKQLPGVKASRLCSMNEDDEDKEKDEDEDEEKEKEQGFPGPSTTTTTITPASPRVATTAASTSPTTRTVTIPNRYGVLGMRSLFPSIDSLTSSAGRSTSQPQPPLPTSAPPIPPLTQPPTHPSPSPRPPSPPHNVPTPLPQRPPPAHKRPAFKSRPSLPSLNTLATMDFIPGLDVSKVRKGKVGARLPFEPWKEPNSSEETSCLEEEEEETVTGCEGGEKSLPPFPTSVSVVESASTSGHELKWDQDPLLTPTPPTPPPKPSSVFTPSPKVQAHIVADMPPPTDIGAAADIDLAAASSSVGLDVTHQHDVRPSSLNAKDTLEVGQDSHHLSDAVLALGHDNDVQAYAGTLDDDGYDDVDQFMDQFMEHYDRVDQEEDESITTGSNGRVDAAFNGLERETEGEAIAIVIPDALSSEPDMKVATTPPPLTTTTLATPAMTLSTPPALLEDGLTCESSTAVAPALAMSTWKQDPRKVDEGLSSSTHKSNGFVESHAIHPATSDESQSSDPNSDSDGDDDIPLAKSIPSALTAQTTIRRQFRQEKEKRKQDKALRGMAETTRTRLTTLRPTGAASSSFSSSSISHAQRTNSMRETSSSYRYHTHSSPRPIPAPYHHRRSLSRSRNSLERLRPSDSTPAKSHDDHQRLFKSHRYESSSARPGIRISTDVDKPQRAPSHRLRQVPVPPPTSSPANPSAVTSKPEVVVQQRVFISSMQRFNMVAIGETTTAGDVIQMIEAEGSLKDLSGSGGWMVFEVAQDFGMERPIRSFEIIADVQASWNKDKMVNYLVLRMTPLNIPLNRSAIPSSSPTHSGYIEWEAKRGKWSKRFLQLREHSIWLSKRDNRQDQVLICSLSNFDAYQVTRAHRAPKAFAFAVKSTDKLSFFENTADYLHSFACSEKDGKIWMEKILVARSYVLLQERHVLFNPRAHVTNGNASVLSRSGTRKAIVPRPLVDVFEPGSLLSKQP